MQPQVAGSDQLFQLRYAPAKARCAHAHPVTSCLTPLPLPKLTWRGAAGSSTSLVPHATLTTTQDDPHTRPLRCSAVEQTTYPQQPAVDLQSQVDRLTKLLDTLQAASGWHDKARNTLGICCWKLSMSRPNNFDFLQVLALQDEPGTQAFFSNYRQAPQPLALYSEHAHVHRLHSVVTLQAQGSAAARASVSVC